ncbi:ComE operon protein [Flavobacteriaceae bacterium UJ101]|nr:ComE operon protein [Flavobacteriaceae bacterium UJ101]
MLFFLLISITLISFLLKQYLILFINFIFIGWIYFQQYNQIPKNHFQNTSLKNSYCKALIIEKGSLSESGFSSFQAEIQSVFNDSIAINTSGKAILYIKDSVGLLPNTTLIFKNDFDSIPTSKNPYAFDYANFLKKKKIYHHIFTQNIKQIPSSNLNFFAYCHYTRYKIIQKIEKKYGHHNEVSIMKAMLLGEKDHLSFNLKQHYSKTGTMHLLAISGLHTGIIYGCLYLLLYFLTFLPKGTILRITISLLLLWLYASLTGFSASVCRASLMITIYQLSTLLNRDTNSIHTICLSACILLIINPNFLFDVGFQLSYSAVLSILLFFPYFQNSITFQHPILRFYYHATLISIIATIGTLPLSLYYFNSFPTLFLVSNLVITPLFSIIIGLGLIVILFLLLDIPFSFIEILFFKVLSLMNSFISWGYDLNLQIETIYFSKTQVALSYLVIFSFYFFLKRKKYLYLYGICILLLGIQSIYIYQKITRYTISEFIIFDSYKNPIIGIKKGNKLTIFSEHDISTKEYYYILHPYITYQFISHIQYHHLNDTIQIPYLKTKNIFQFKNQIIWINPPKQIANKKDYIFITDLNLLKNIDKKNVITHRYHISDSIYQTPKKGAFRLQISF